MTPTFSNRQLNHLLRYAVLLLVAFGVLAPLLATVLGGFKSLGDLRVNAFGLPTVWEWKNYWDILAGKRYWGLMWNSTVIAAFTVFLTVAVSAMAAYVFVHIRFFGSGFFSSLISGGLGLGFSRSRISLASCGGNGCAAERSGLGT